jgi:hypothetical protein
MTDEEEIALAKALPKGSRRAMMLMTTTPTLPGRETFNANAAHNLRWRARKHGGLADYILKEGRAAYFLTPLGLRVRDRLTAGRKASPERNDHAD